MDMPKPPSGRDIWHAVKDEFSNNLYVLPLSTLAPTLYHVYLHPEDYDEIDGIAPRIVSEVAKALTAEVERINQDGARPRRFQILTRQKPDATPIEVPPAGWTIHIQPDQDGDVARGALGIVSKLMLPAPPEYHGTPTVRIVKTVFTEGRRQTVSTELQPLVEDGREPSAGGDHAAPRSHSSETRRAAPDGSRATLSYEDQEGAHVFVVRKECIKVGRGGMGTWVDVQLMTDPRVSREHCWISCDLDGHFSIQDVSTWGTFVNGQPLPPPLRSTDGPVVQPGAKTELPPGARIALADSVVIQFRSGAPE